MFFLLQTRPFSSSITEQPQLFCSSALFWSLQIIWLVKQLIVWQMVLYPAMFSTHTAGLCQRSQFLVSFAILIFKWSHCSNSKKVLNENDTPWLLQFLFVYRLEIQNLSLLTNSVGIHFQVMSLRSHCNQKCQF